MKNYLKIAFISYLNQKIYTFINVVGFSIGLTCSMLIGLYAWNEMSYDRFHTNADRMYRVCFNLKLGDNTVAGPITAAPTADALAKDYPEVEKTVRIWKNENQAIEYENKLYYETRYFYADPQIFDFFTFQFVQGSTQNALQQPNTVVISESASKRYFGDRNPIGKLLKSYGNVLEVTGVVKDFPVTSHFHFDFLVSMSTFPDSKSNAWFSHMNYITYVLLKKGADPKALEAKFPDMIKKYGGPDIMKHTGKSLEELLKTGTLVQFSLQKLTDIHLHSNYTSELEPNGNITHVNIFILVALFILAIACINFTNLSTARSACRSKEVGLRKTMGSGKMQLVYQFLGESVLLTFISVIISYLLAYQLLPVIGNMIGLTIDDHLIKTIWLIPVMIGFSLVVGIIAGSYPAFYLSSFNPAEVLKGKLKTGISGGWLRNSLVLVQFIISLSIMLCTSIVYLQMKHLQKKELGFDKNELIVLEKLDPIDRSVKFFIDELLKNPAIENASLTTSVPCRGSNFGGGYQLEGGEEQYLINLISSDNNFARTMGIRLAEGRYFSHEFPSDSSAIVVNESVVRYMGIKDPIGKRIIAPDGTGNRNYLTIVGVAKDFNFESPRLAVSPMIIRMENNWGKYIVIRAAKGKNPQAMAHINEVWKKVAGNSAINYFYFDQEFNKSFKSEGQTKTVLSIFALLSIVIASLGLFGLNSFTTVRRTKEIGVRKILGSSIQSIIFLLSKETLLLIGLAMAIASPVVWLIMDYWLQDFAYRIDIPIWIFFGAALVATFIALTAIMANVVNVAIKNPTQALRYE